MADVKRASDKQTIFDHLTHLTRRWHELAEPCLLEVVFLTAEDKARVSHVAHYNPDPLSLDIAADDIIGMNAHGVNAYATVNPVSRDDRPPAGKRANASQIVAAFFHFADADDDQAAENIRNFAGPKCNFHVLTGTQPSLRPHVYWELEEPTYNLAAWSETQKAIAATLGTDSSVTDPPRIMRIAGTVNWPKPKKVAKGYMPEIVELKFYDEDDRPLVTSEQMHRAFAGRAPRSGFEIDTGATATLDRALATANIKAGTDWRDNVKSLVASYVARGWTDDEIIDRCLAFTLPGWTHDDTREDVAAFIKWTREQEARNGGKYAVSPETTPSSPAAIVPTPEGDPFEAWETIDPLTLPRREFVYGNHYVRKFASVTVAPGGLGKSTLVLAEAIAIATGRNILGVQPRSRERVVYYNAEDPREEIQRRVIATLQLHGINQSEIAGWLYTSSGRDKNLILAAGEMGDICDPIFEYINVWAQRIKPAVYIFDPLANMTESPETNDVFRKLGRRLSMMADEQNCSIEIVHHTRKLNGREAEIEDSRGGGALLGAVRAGRVLNPMTADESVRAGLDTHIDHFRIEAAGKNNLARPSPNAVWLERVGVQIPNGDFVATVRAWEWPDAFDGVSAEDARKVQVAVAEMEDNPPRENAQSKAWVGHVVGRVLGFDTDDKTERERVKQMVKAWVKSGVLMVEEARDTRTGREVKYVMAGPNNPTSEGV